MELEANKEVDVVAQASWGENINTSDLLDLGLPKAYFEIVQAYYEIGYRKGRSCTVDSMREIYENDVDLFEEFFENAVEDGRKRY